MPTAAVISSRASPDHDRLFDLAAGYASNFASYAVNTEGIRTINVFRLSSDGS